MTEKLSRYSREQALIDALAKGVNQTRAARESGYSVRTVRRKLEDSEFRQRVALQRKEMVRRATGSLAAAGASAVRTLLQLMAEGKSEQIRLSAARTVIQSLPIEAILSEVAEMEEPREIRIVYTGLRESILQAEKEARIADLREGDGDEGEDLREQVG